MSHGLISLDYGVAIFGGRIFERTIWVATNASCRHSRRIGAHLCSIYCFWCLDAILGYIYCFTCHTFAVGHTIPNAPDPIRTLKLSGIRLG